MAMTKNVVIKNLLIVYVYIHFGKQSCDMQKFDTYKPNIYSSTLMFWGLMWCLTDLQRHNMTSSLLTGVLAVATLYFGIMSCVYLTKFVAKLREFL